MGAIDPLAPPRWHEGWPTPAGAWRHWRALRQANQPDCARQVVRGVVVGVIGRLAVALTPRSP